MLLAVLTALIIVRPFARGEDPGHLSDFSDPSGMALTLLTLAGCAGWAVWRLWSRQQMLPLGTVEIGLFALTALYFIGAGFAPYSRAAYLAASEWLGLALLVFFARQMVSRPEEQQGLLAVLLATAVALSVQGVWQAGYELPALARSAGTPEQAIEEQDNGRLISPVPLEKAQQIDQLRRRAVSGPFFHPSSLAACLVLLLPGLVSAVVACARSRAPHWLALLAVILALLAAVVLGMTRDALALAALALAGLVWAGLYLPARLGGARVGVTGGLVLAGLAIWGLYAGGELSAPLARWREVWPATRRLVEDHFWLGVGPAQFSFFYPRYMAVAAGYRMADPASSLLEVLAEVGVGGVLMLLLVLAVFFRGVVRWWRAEGKAIAADQPVEADAGAKPTPPSLAEPPEIEAPVRWEYYLGGMLAAVLSFVLRAMPHPGEDLIPEAISAGVRAVAWFVAFGVLERIAWSRGEYVGGLVVGIAALLLLFLVEPGLAYPSVAGLLWVAVALVLVLVAPPLPGWLGRQGWVGAIALPLFLGGGFGYLALVFSPAATASGNTQKARLAAALFIYDQRKPREEHTIRNAPKYVFDRVIQPLEDAERDDRGNVRTRVMLATWWVQEWMISPPSRRNVEMGKRGIAYAIRAQQANPEDRDGYLAEYNARLSIAAAMKLQVKRMEDESKKRKMDEKQKKALRAGIEGQQGQIRELGLLAARALEPYIPRDPTDPELRFRLAAALIEAGEVETGREQAREADRLDGLVGRPRRLSLPQREQLVKWLEGTTSP